MKLVYDMATPIQEQAREHAEALSRVLADIAREYHQLPDEAYSFIERVLFHSIYRPLLDKGMFAVDLEQVSEQMNIPLRVLVDELNRVIEEQDWEDCNWYADVTLEGAYPING